MIPVRAARGRSTRSVTGGEAVKRGRPYRARRIRTLVGVTTVNEPDISAPYSRTTVTVVRCLSSCVVPEIGYARTHFRDVVDFMPISPQSIHDGAIHGLIAHELHAASCGTGYTTSARSTSAAKARAAWIASVVRTGFATRRSSTVSPAANRSRIDSTVMRVPATTGFPIMMVESDMIRVFTTTPFRPTGLALQKMLRVPYLGGRHGAGQGSRVWRCGRGHARR